MTWLCWREPHIKETPKLQPLLLASMHPHRLPWEFESTPMTREVFESSQKSTRSHRADPAPAARTGLFLSKYRLHIYMGLSLLFIQIVTMSLFVNCPSNQAFFTVESTAMHALGLDSSTIFSLRCRSIDDVNDGNVTGGWKTR